MNSQSLFSSVHPIYVPDRVHKSLSNDTAYDLNGSTNILNFMETESTPSVQDKYHSKFGPMTDLAIAVYLIIILIGALLLNSIVILIEMRNWKKIKPIEIFILNLALTNILFSLTFFMPIHSAINHRWVFGEIGTTLYGFWGFFSGMCSINNLAVTSIFRCIKTCFKEYGPGINKSSVYLTTGVVYIYSLIWALLPMFNWGNYAMEPSGLHSSIEWNGQKSFIISVFTVAIMLPVLIMMFCYINIILIVSRSNSINPKVGHVTKMTFLMCASFLICWLPYGIISMVSAFGGSELVPVIVLTVPTVFAKISVVLTPLIYYYMIATFRNRLKMFLFGDNQIKTNLMNGFRQINHDNTSTIATTPLDELIIDIQTVI